MRLPHPRGPLSERVITALRQLPEAHVALPPAPPSADPLADPDLHLALAVCYELHYRGFDDVDDGWEWHAGLLAWRAGLEQVFESALRSAVAPRLRAISPELSVDLALREVIDTDDGFGMSTYLMRHADEEQLNGYLRQRSLYHLKEADPQTWAVPRLAGPAKAALVEILSDEYGAGLGLGRMHSAMFASTMREVGLDDAYGAYWDEALGSMLAVVNAMTMFGLQRRLRGAAAGEIATIEMTSAVPSGRLSNALRRLGHGEPARRFYDEHVEADAVHEQIAAVDLCGSLVAAEPHLRDDVIFGAAASLALEGRFARDLLDRWGIDAASSRGQVA